MKRTNSEESGPGKQYVDDLWPLLAQIYALLEGGKEEAYKYFDERGYKKVDPWYFSHTVRMFVCRGLDSLKRRDLEFKREPLDMSGIEVAYKGKRIKVLKAGEDGEPPAPNTEARKGFYQANLFSNGDHVVRNLVVVWDITSARELVVGLSCPRMKDEFTPPDAAASIWMEPIPHPATRMEPEKQEPPVEEDVDDTYELRDDDELEKSESGDDE